MKKGKVELIRPLKNENDETVTIEIDAADLAKAIPELAKKVADFNINKLKIARKIHAGNPNKFTVTQQKIIHAS